MDWDGDGAPCAHVLAGSHAEQCVECGWYGCRGCLSLTALVDEEALQVEEFDARNVDWNFRCLGCVEELARLPSVAVLRLRL